MSTMFFEDYMQENGHPEISLAGLYLDLDERRK